MKRPLLWAALLLTLGVMLLSSGEETRNKWLLKKPSVRMALERSSSGCFPVSIKGIVLWAEEKDGRMVYRLDAGKTYGTVLVYEPEEPGTKTEDPALLIGSTCRVSGIAFLFQPAENPGQFDVQGYYDDQGIWFGVSQAEIWTDEPSRFSLRREFYRFKEAFRQTIRENASQEDAEFLLYLTLSENSDEGEALRNQAAALSAIQLLSLSGFIISSIGMLIYKLLRKLCRDLVFCAVIPAALMILYFCVLGSPVSMIRALVIFLIRISAPMLKRRFDTISAASLSVILLAVMKPTYLLLPGMSFYLAVLVSQGIICPAVRRIFFKQKVLPSVLLSFFSMQACLLPVQILTRYAWSPYGMLLVWFLLPLRTASGILTLIGGILGILLKGMHERLLRGYFMLPAALRHLYSMVFEAMARLPFSSYNAGRPPVYKSMFYALLLSMPPVMLGIRFHILRNRRVRNERRVPQSVQYLFPALYMMIMVLGMIFLRAAPVRGSEMVYTMLSVGQGDSGLVRTEEMIIGMDCGSSSRDDAGSLFTGAAAYYGIQKIDILTLSHEDQDHTNGLKTILEDPSLRVGEIWIPDTRTADDTFAPLIALAAENGVPVRKAGAGDRLVRRDMVVTVLSPVHGADLTGNEQSLVIQISHKGQSVLFTGDVSAETEERILKPDQKTDILKVAHHGSRFSSGEKFIREVSPAAAFVSYGKNNTYGHPSVETLQRFTSAGIRVYGTGKSGAIEAALYEGCISLEFYGPEKAADLPLN